MEILATSAVIAVSAPSWFGAVMLFLCVTFVFSLILSIAFDSVATGVVCLISFVLLIVIGRGFYDSEKTDTGRLRLEVLLDDNYSAKALYESYDLIEVRGDIWVIEEKEGIELEKD